MWWDFVDTETSARFRGALSKKDGIFTDTPEKEDKTETIPHHQTGSERDANGEQKFIAFISVSMLRIRGDRPGVRI